jgi:Zn-dependent protease
MITQSGSFRLFRIEGIEVFLHWSWFIVAVFAINNRRDSYSSLAWNVAEYVALFVIVLLHEFGHALACRQVGGEANRIVLWPLVEVVLVNPPTSHRDGPIFLNVLRVLDAPEALGLLAPRPLTMYTSQDAAFARTASICGVAGGTLRTQSLP